MKIRYVIDDPNNVALGRYVSLARVIHTDNEFTLDCYQIFPLADVENASAETDVVQKGVLLGRFYFSPQHFKKLMLLIQQKMADYETAHGVVPVPTAVPIPPVVVN